MITEKEIARINELYHKSKEGGGLTAEEKNEQAKLRRAYIDSVKANLGVYLKDIKNASKDAGSDMDPAEAKKNVKKAMEATDKEMAEEKSHVIEVAEK
ncbi:hypothetical protein BXO88_09340 [Oribacterium sp. C9]|uniref:DUF896 domain-containing protein n=1 Tax=Oribacterium sp. C9 TaxID=1943579 RepID=UPI0009C90F33|nr:DUF896 domain-containing protein [Oribacterium sp. C9]OON86029.1 hypothetical protein BXO88_09340 [Oribacterium sp. C9]